MTPTATRLLKTALILAVAGATSSGLVQAQLPQAVGTWSVQGSLADPRTGAASVVLDDGRTLVLGGRLADGSVTDSVVAYDPVANGVTSVGQLFAPRVNAAATLLEDGRVVLSGGHVGSEPSADVEIFDPVAGTSTFAATMAVPRAWHASARLPEDRVLLVGGVTTGGTALATAEIFGPQTGSVAPAGTMATPRVGLSATTLLQGHVLIAGGNDGAQDLASAEIFDPYAGNMFVPVPTSMSVARSGHTAVLLKHNAGVLIAGGTAAGATVTTTDLFLPAIFPDPYSWGIGSFASTGALTTPRAFGFGGPAGDNGFAYVAGGGADSMEAYRHATIKTDKDDYEPGERAVITGTGWQPGENVTLVFQEDPPVHDDYSFPVTADALGNIYWDQWAPEEHDLGVRFYLTAQDTQSRAQITFTDARVINAATLTYNSVTVSCSGAPCTPPSPLPVPTSATVSASLTVTGDGNANQSEWQSTGLTFSLSATPPGTQTGPECIDTPDQVAGPHTVTFNAPAPENSGTYYAHFRAYRSPACVVQPGAQQPSQYFTITAAIIVDGIAPTVLSINRSNSTPTNAASVSWTVQFSEQVTDVDSGDFVLAAAGLTGSPAITGVVGSGATYTVSADTGNGSGTLGLNLIDNDSIADGAGNALSGTGSGNGNFTGQVYSLDRTLTPAITVDNKPYDGTAAATILTRTVTSALSLAGHDVSLTGGAATFSDANAATGKTATATGLALSGADAGRFILSATTATATANITPRPASVTPDPASKVYGEADPAFTGTLSGFLAADGVTATYTRNAGETVAVSPYTINATLSPAGVLGNYTITYNTALFTITPRAASVTPDAATKVYGEADPTFTGTLSGFLAADGVTATYTRTAGETVAASPYTISATLSPAGVLGNYTITYNTAAFTITPRAASVTPDAATKVYGEADPAFTGALSGFLAADGVTATYTRTAGETVAGSPYTINASLSPAGVLGNYTITYNTALFTITPRAASVTPNPDTKVYGEADPTFTGTLSGFLAADGVTATYTRTAGETVAASPYTISATLSPAGVLGNYTITYNTAAFTISPRPASVTPDAASKVYGEADPAFTGTLSGFLAADGVTATYTRTAGETVAGSPYTISATLSPAGVLGNYTITYNTAAFTISPRPASVTPDAASKVYGEADPAFTGTLSGFLTADGVAATYARTAGETVAGSPYTISATLSPTGVLGNYTITYNTASFTITPRAASVTPIGDTKVYGEADPAFTGTLSGFLPDDGVTATYTRTAGETVLGSPYTISATLSPAGVLGNYTIAYNTAQFTITPRAASVTPIGDTKVYGEADPAFTGTLSGFLPDDGVTATYTRTAGETVLGSPYTISATLSPAGVLGNYTITYNTALFTISLRSASVTPAPAGKIYGDPEPTLTGSLSGFVAADGVTATYSRAAGETVAGGPYTISATLSPDGVLSNYDITYNTAPFTISLRPASVTPALAGKIYGDPEPTLTGTLSGFVPADGVTASYARAAGETVAGSPYTISATLSPAGALANYTITYNTAAFTISARAASVTPNPATKVYGAADPALTGTLSGFLPADGVTASYARTAGETVASSPYTISATLSPAAVLGNYAITYNTAAFTISPRAASVTPNPATKVFGAPDPTLTGTLSGFLAADGVTASYSRTGGEAVTLPGIPYTISATLSPAAVLGNYAITYNTAPFTITAWVLSGFFQPVGIPNTVAGAPASPPNYLWNTIKGGQTVPLKFEIFTSAGGTELTSVGDVLPFTLAALPCSYGYDDPVDPGFDTPGATVLRYSDGHFIQNWDSPKGANRCYRVTMTARDGSQLSAFFKTK